MEQKYAMFGGVAVLFLFSTLCSSSSGVEKRMELIKTLLHQYNPTVRPRVNYTDCIDINVTWNVLAFMGLEDRQPKFRHATEVKSTWKDNFLTWNISQYNNITSIALKGSQIWTPIIEVINRHAGSFLVNGFERNMVRIWNDGRVEVSSSGFVDTMCNVDPKYFPFDRQTCQIIVTVQRYFSWEVNIQNLTLIISKSKKPHPLWEVTSFSTTGSSRSLISINLEFQRKSLYYVFSMISPSAILGILLVIGLVLPDDHGEKIMCGTTIFLSYIVFLSQAGDTIPESSDSLLNIGVYYLLLMVSGVVMITNSVIVCFLSSNFIRLFAWGCNKAKILPLVVSASTKKLRDATPTYANKRDSVSNSQKKLLFFCHMICYITVSIVNIAAIIALFS